MPQSASFYRVICVISQHHLYHFEKWGLGYERMFLGKAFHSGNALISCLLTDKIGVFYVRLSLKEKVKIAYLHYESNEIVYNLEIYLCKKNNIFFYFIYLCGRCLFVNLNMKLKR